MPQDVIAELRKDYDALTPAQRRIAAAIVDDPESAAFATVDRLAARLGVSPSTVVRFAYRIGLRGYGELQARVREHLRSQLRSNGVPADGEREITTHLGDSVLARSLARDVEELRRTIIGLSRDDLERAASIVVNARRVLVVNDATSHGLAAYAVGALEQFRDGVRLVDTDVSAAVSLLSATGADAMVVVAFAPHSQASLRMTEWARGQGVRVVAVTDSPLSPVGQRADVVLGTAPSGPASAHSLVAATAVLNALVNGVAAASPDSANREARIIALLRSWDVLVPE